MNVEPHSVSGRVVKTARCSSSSPSIGKRISAPCERPMEDRTGELGAVTGP